MLGRRKGVSARNDIYGKIALVLTLIIRAKHKNFGAAVLGNFLRSGVQLIWRTVRQGPTVLTVGAGWDCLAFFYLPFFLSLSGKRFEIH